MNKHSLTVASVALLAAGFLLGAGPVPTRDANRVPGTQDTRETDRVPGTQGAPDAAARPAAYQANYHADYRVKMANEPATGSQETGARTEEQRRDDQFRDALRDSNWRGSPTMAPSRGLSTGPR
jgi:hypothetical protein